MVLGVLHMFCSGVGGAVERLALRGQATSHLFAVLKPIQSIDPPGLPGTMGCSTYHHPVLGYPERTGHGASPDPGKVL